MPQRQRQALLLLNSDLFPIHDLLLFVSKDIYKGKLLQFYINLLSGGGGVVQFGSVNPMGITKTSWDLPCCPTVPNGCGPNQEAIICVDEINCI